MVVGQGLHWAVSAPEYHLLGGVTVGVGGQLLHSCSSSCGHPTTVWLATVGKQGDPALIKCDLCSSGKKGEG